MRILVINSFYKPDIGGGAEITIASLYSALVKRGVEVTVLATTNKAPKREENVDGVTVVRVPIWNIYWHFRKRFPPKLIRALWYLIDIYNPLMKVAVDEAIKKYKPDCIICHNIAGWSTSAWVSAKTNKIPVIQVLHDSYLMCPSSLMFKNGRACNKPCTTCRLFRMPYKGLSESVAGVTGVSAYILNKVTEFGLFPNSEKRVVHNARDIDPPLRLGAANRPIIFGYIGTVMPAKGLSWLVEQFSQTGLTNKLLIAGRGDQNYIDELRQLGVSADIEFLGHVSASEFFDSIDVCVVPSIWPDTFPGVAFEACAYSVPVICSNRGGLPEIIKPGLNGVICDPDCPESLGEAMVEMVRDEAQLSYLKRNAKSSVKEMINFDRMITEHLDFIQHTVSTHQNATETIYLGR